ncbi:protein of unknown function [Clostridium cavendishii DSM 21758]|uniref:DUF3783 domain-containing protein n=1 Tax=Clostridium cavendishii DSM 21758 TaxID=1121302 RepID=A0A1M6PJN8_9CLOT|nr:DUF3783 domain-containing protein [Clostridium cavendishii]SHK08118.1 protein of unknown function [Clostridium cavendishii DSM 21758]
MLENKKCLLTYGLTEEQNKELQSTGIKIEVINPLMVEMKISDIINGFKFETAGRMLSLEKVVLFNSFSDEDLHKMIKIVKAIAGAPILAVVTPTSEQWTFANLLEHLMEEREWYSKQGKGR